MNLVSLQSQKGFSLDVVSIDHDILQKNKGLRHVARKLKNSQISRAASPVSSNCKIMSLDETDFESWKSSRELRRTLKEIKTFCRYLTKKKQRRKLAEQRF
jgi:hypothetical protein